jgi:hypothetical protein
MDNSKLVILPESQHILQANDLSTTPSAATSKGAPTVMFIPFAVDHILPGSINAKCRSATGKSGKLHSIYSRY